MTTLYLFRHGLTKEASLHLYCGKTDVPLSAKGIELLNQQKKNMPVLSGFSFYTSGMIRANMTIQILYPEVSYICEPALKEIDFGIFECHSYEELKNNYSYQMWISGSNELNVCPGGESNLQMKERVICFIKKLLCGDEDKRIAIFTHGGPITALMQYFFPHENKNFYDWQCDFGGGYKIQLDKKNSSYTKLQFNRTV